MIPACICLHPFQLQNFMNAPWMRVFVVRVPSVDPLDVYCVPITRHRVCSCNILRHRRPTGAKSLYICNPFHALQKFCSSVSCCTAICLYSLLCIDTAAASDESTVLRFYTHCSFLSTLDRHWCCFRCIHRPPLPVPLGTSSVHFTTLSYFALRLCSEHFVSNRLFFAPAPACFARLPLRALRFTP